VWGWQPYHLHGPIVLKSGNLKLLESSRLVQACNGVALYFTWWILLVYILNCCTAELWTTVRPYHNPVREVTPTRWPNDGRSVIFVDTGWNVVQITRRTRRVCAPPLALPRWMLIGMANVPNTTADKNGAHNLSPSLTVFEITKHVREFWLPKCIIVEST